MKKGREENGDLGGLRHGYLIGVGGGLGGIALRVGFLGQLEYSGPVLAKLKKPKE